MKWFRKKIAAKLTLQSCLLVVAMVLAIGGLSFYKSSKAITTEVEGKLSAKLDSAIIKLESQNQLISEKLTMLGRLGMVKDFAEKPESFAAISAMLKSSLDDNQEYLETLFIADATGTIVMDGSLGKDVGLNISDRAYFKEAIGGTTVLSDVVTSKGTGNLVRVFAYPVKNKTGNVVGILSAVIKLEPIAREVLNLKEGNNGYGFLIDKNGVILVHPKAEYVGKNLTEFNIPELTAAMPDMIAGKEGHVDYTYKGISKLNLYKPMNGFSLSLNADRKEYLKPVTDMGNTIMLFGIVFMAIGGLFSFVIAKVIAVKIGRMQHVLKLAEEGDLTVRVTGKTLNDGDEIDQMGLSVNHMLTSFNQVIGDIVEAAEIMTSTSEEMAASAEEGGKAAGEVTASIQQISAGLQDQTEHVLKTSDIVELMQGQIDSTVLETKSMSIEAKKVLDTAKESQGFMNSTMNQMGEIQESSLTTFQIVKKLSSESERIGQISLAISAIADQTNLLALNAAIEAARAGEQGRGFAVVAEEIRKLASESMTSAEDIGKLIQSIQSEIEHAEKAINAESEAINKGVAVIEDTKGAFSHIIEAVEKTSDIMNSVLGSIEKTKASTYDVTNSVHFISGVTQESSASAEEVTASTEEQNAIAEEIASAAEHLSRLATNLMQQVAAFKVSK